MPSFCVSAYFLSSVYIHCVLGPRLPEYSTFDPAFLSWNTTHRQPLDVRPAPIRSLFLVSASSAASPAFGFDFGLALLPAHNDFSSYITTCIMLSFVAIGYSRVLTLDRPTAFSYFPPLSTFNSVFTLQKVCHSFTFNGRYIRAGVFTDQARTHLTGQKKRVQKRSGGREERFWWLCLAFHSFLLRSCCFTSAHELRRCVVICTPVYFLCFLSLLRLSLLLLPLLLFLYCFFNLKIFL